MSFPKISVCIPSYDGETYLAKCLESIRRQTFTDIEILIVDDDSADRTIKIATELSRTDRRIRVVRNPQRLGLAGNWNRCLQLAVGEWIKFVFQDDCLEPDCLDALLKACNNTGARFGFCHRRVLFQGDVDPDVRRFLERLPLLQEKAFGDRVYIPPQEFNRLSARYLLINLVGEPTSTLFHRSVVDAYGLFDTSLMQWPDLDFWLRVCSHEGAAQVTAPLACFRAHGKSATSGNRDARRYATGLLEPLALLWKILRDERYRGLRCPNSLGLANLAVRCATLAFQAWGTAFMRKLYGSPDMMREWRAFTATRPALAFMAPLGAPFAAALLLYRFFRCKAGSSAHQKTITG